MRKYLYLAAVLLASIFIVSCEKKNKDQNKRPVITILETSVPQISADVCGTIQDNVLPMLSGEELRIKMRFEGAHELSEYKIDIHPNYDCHGHERPLSEWEYLHIAPVSGKLAEVTEHIAIPEDAFSGNYHCVIRLIDELGNEAEFVSFTIQISNALDSEAPQFQRELPAADSISLQRDTHFVLKGLVLDNYSLQGGKLSLECEDANGNDIDFDEISFGNADIQSVSVEQAYVLPASIANGLAVFTIRIYDAQYNRYEEQIKVNILP
ncbi:MAG TPA: DUF4625 domain-containing protein [Edaphocola sp.]|nr:DUF4625 domain-containing protein [Edaphocola sp.]